MSKKTIIIILSVLVAAATAAIELLSSCSTGTILHRVTPVDSVYYERHVDFRSGSLSSFGTNDTTFRGLHTIVPYGRNYVGSVYLKEM